MNRAMTKNKKIDFSSVLLRLCVLLLFSFLTSCSQFDEPKTEPFYAETAPPQKKEFRWSNGKMPKSFDPALAAAPPEADVVRAVYEGLTEIDPKTLAAVPAAAADWKASDDFRTWTFNLRKTARWSNGERVTAKIFVRSWQRLAEMRERVAHRELLQNIVGINVPQTETPATPENEDAIFSRPSNNQNELSIANQTNSNSTAVPYAEPQSIEFDKKAEVKTETKFGVEAADNFTLVVTLVKPDKNFPVLVAHPIFRPVYAAGKEFETNKLNAAIVTNGAFRIASVGQDGITLDRAENYWNRETVELERVRFVPAESAEKALAAYRAGEVDAVTNADFEPLALKLLTPYEDFRRTTYSAINFYEFNRSKPPFDDRRVREALAISIERERITEDEMDGASKPALSFLPFEKAGEKTLVQDAQKAKELLSESGFPNGLNFPKIKLLVNRNNVQQRIARSVAKMWKRNLNVETEIIVKESEELTTARTSDDYDLIRRGVVLATNDETVNMMAIFAALSKPAAEDTAPNSKSDVFSNENPNANSSVSTPEEPKTVNETPLAAEENPGAETIEEAILTEEEAISELPAIPLYFPTSYSLVKPYVQGFEINILDAPSLKDVRIDNNWQPKTAKGES
jgi:oligopeptide transport system substrate-binding protein